MNSKKCTDFGKWSLTWKKKFFIWKKFIDFFKDHWIWKRSPILKKVKQCSKMFIDFEKNSLNLCKVHCFFKFIDLKISSLNLKIIHWIWAKFTVFKKSSSMWPGPALTIPGPGARQKNGPPIHKNLYSSFDISIATYILNIILSVFSIDTLNHISYSLFYYWQTDNVQLKKTLHLTKHGITSSHYIQLCAWGLYFHDH